MKNEKIVLGTYHDGTKGFQVFWNPAKGFECELVEPCKITAARDALAEAILNRMIKFNDGWARYPFVGRPVIVTHGDTAGVRGIVTNTDGHEFTVRLENGTEVVVLGHELKVVDPNQYMLPVEKLREVAENAAETLDWGVLYRRGAVIELLRGALKDAGLLM